MCRCGFLWTLKAETTYGSYLLPNEVVLEEYGEAPPQFLEYAAQQSQVLRCPNCRAVIVENEDGIHFFVTATEPPRLYVVRSDRDALGVLCHRGLSLVPANFVPVRVCAIELCLAG